MICPKCGGDTTVVDSAFSASTNTFYRKRKCLTCGERIHTAESLIEVTDSVRHEIYANSRQLAYKNAKRRPKRRNVKVRCLDTGDVYDSPTIASKALNISRSGITKCCKGHHHTCGGYRWEYYEENKKE